ncbi:MAG: hypothetical protein BM557_01190 [Flavobacterium sp. MedPE-SWcel]|uniref:ParB N-terminal domain-containing protein n=1 Tax=uncultured Flavobacterium sp. TaxID=165435 RepID=UPI000917F570|nr:ParB N-terminal domain-containing protein [uncultured Flavobacterium sp.]OIQ22022.1 MAG: hypothetical protein BM557_01190 [Flavobacterium sp. MedPE-SWcel]
MKTHILETNDYSIFSSITGNRNISVLKINKLVKDINSGFNMLPYCPIIVSKTTDDKFSIIDGQHRFEASKETGNPIYYVICDTLSLNKIALLNSRGDKWKPSDFLNCYIKIGIPDYIKLKSITDKYKVSIKVAVDLLMFNKANTGKPSDAFQSGEFKCKYLEETEHLLDLSISLFGRYVFTMDRHLLAAIQKLIASGKCDFDILSKKIGLKPVNMNKNADTKSYLRNIEDIYNYKNSKRQVLY